MINIYCTTYQAPWTKGECRIDFCPAESVEEANATFKERYNAQRLIILNPKSTKAVSAEGYKISLEKIV